MYGLTQLNDHDDLFSFSHPGKAILPFLSLLWLANKNGKPLKILFGDKA